jgi:hypothetical protein
LEKGLMSNMNQEGMKKTWVMLKWKPPKFMMKLERLTQLSINMNMGDKAKA